MLLPAVLLGMVPSIVTAYSKAESDRWLNPKLSHLSRFQAVAEDSGTLAAVFSRATAGFCNSRLRGSRSDKHCWHSTTTAKKRRPSGRSLAMRG